MQICWAWLTRNRVRTLKNLLCFDDGTGGKRLGYQCWASPRLGKDTEIGPHPRYPVGYLAKLHSWTDRSTPDPGFWWCIRFLGSSRWDHDLCRKGWACSGGPRIFVWGGLEKFGPYNLNFLPSVSLCVICMVFFFIDAYSSCWNKIWIYFKNKEDVLCVTQIRYPIDKTGV